MPLQYLRDDAEIRCLPEDQLAPSPKLLAFTPRAEMSDYDRLLALEQIDPKGAERLRRALHRLYDLAYGKR